MNLVPEKQPNAPSIRAAFEVVQSAVCSTFEELFDLPFFIETLRDDVAVVAALPAELQSAPVARKHFKTWSDLEYYNNMIAPLWQDYKVRPTFRPLSFLETLFLVLPLVIKKLEREQITNHNHCQRKVGELKMSARSSPEQQKNEILTGSLEARKGRLDVKFKICKPRSQIGLFIQCVWS